MSTRGPNALFRADHDQNDKPRVVSVRHVLHSADTERAPTSRHHLTPPVKAALDELRDQLGDTRIDLPELVILGAHQKVAQLRAEQDHTGLGGSNSLTAFAVARFPLTARQPMRSVEPAGLVRDPDAAAR